MSIIIPARAIMRISMFLNPKTNPKNKLIMK